ncbi:MAG: hypothetical protein IT314_04210, partial [Anaerolineales bacterium]|nr:hypothetical protein [Anaerolineales bacterium]
KVDDFGGGTLSSGMQSMLAGGETVFASSETLEADSWNVEINSASQFWQGVPMDSDQTSTVTFATIQARTSGLLPKPESNGLWGDDVAQVFYDVRAQRIQVWMYDSESGWALQGKDIRTKIAAGDTFAVRVLANGTVEILRNGKFLARRIAIP